MAGDEDLRKCYRCGDLKPADDFSWRRKAKDERDTFCRPCRSAYGKEHYAPNRQRYIDQAAKVRRRVYRERTAYLIEYFKTHTCVDCGEGDPVVLEFDHLRDKLFDVSRGLSERGWQSVLDEMEKCEVVARIATVAEPRGAAARCARR